MRRAITIVVLTLGCVLPGVPGYAELHCPKEATFTPMSIIEDADWNKAFEEIVNSMKSQDGESYLRFHLMIGADGSIENSCCLAAPYGIQEVGLIYLTTRIEKMKVVPPTRNGVPQPVMTGFTIIATRNDSGVQSRLLPNRMSNRAEHGFDYIAPQRILDKNLWIDRLREDRRRRLARQAYGEVSILVDLLGNPGSGSVTLIEQQEWVLERAAEQIENYCYIPGYVEGKPAEMLYTEHFRH